MADVMPDGLESASGWATELEDEIDLLSLVRNENSAFVVLTLINGTLQIFQLTPKQSIANCL